MPEPLPFAELLAALQERGLPIGLHEHLRVGRLVERWDLTDFEVLRNSLAALLARNPEEAEQIRQAFDELYLAEPEAGAAAEAEEREAAPKPTDRTRIRPQWRTGIRLFLLLAFLLGVLAWNPTPEPVDIVPSSARARIIDPHPPPRISDTVERRDWERALAGSAGGAALIFLGLYGLRMRRASRSRARDLWLDEADALPEPLGYDLRLGPPALPVPATVLDAAASLLGRHTDAPPRAGELDIDRTLEQTLRAGLAPRIVLRPRTTSSSILVLEDDSSSLHPWRSRIHALLAGLEARGVPLDRWLLDTGTARVRPSRGGEELTLETLFRRRGESRLLVISTGEESLRWIGALPVRSCRAWLHPVMDRGYWRPELPEGAIPIQPMTPAGVLAVARHLSLRPPGRLHQSELARFAERSVTALDVDRLRWLLDLAPRRDPDLAELMRRRFFPRVPQAALLEALDSPPLPIPPPGAPAAAEVHAFLADVLVASRPTAGTTAHERWRLDLALQNACVPPRARAAARELADLASGPLAAEVEPAVERLAGPAAGRVAAAPALASRLLLRWRVLRRLQRRAEHQGLALVAAGGWFRQRWRWPSLFEIGGTLLGAALLLALLGLTLHRKEPIATEVQYRLSPTDTGLDVQGPSRVGISADVVLYKGEKPFRDVHLFKGASGEAVLDRPDDRGHWYYVRAPMDNGKLAISEPVWWPAVAPAVPLDSTTTDLTTADGDLASTDSGMMNPMGTDSEPLQPRRTTRKPPRSEPKATLTAPAAPSDLTATYDLATRKMTLAWKDNSDNEQGFTIQFSYSGSQFRDLGSVDANVTTFTTGPGPIGPYTYRVYAFSNGMKSGYSKEAFVLAAPPPND